MPLASTNNGPSGAVGGERAMEGAGPHPDINDLMQRQTQPRGLTAATGTRKGGTDKINMDAYEAYHNSKDNALLLSQTRSEELAKEQTATTPHTQQEKAQVDETANSAKNPAENNTGKNNAGAAGGEAGATKTVGAGAEETKNNAGADSKDANNKATSNAGGKATNNSKVQSNNGSNLSPTTVTTNNYTTVMQDGANINITNINNHHTYVIYR